VCALSRKTVVSVPNGIRVPNSDSKYRCAAPTTAANQRNTLASANALAVNGALSVALQYTLAFAFAADER
jgi:hypothetical protein